MRGRAAPGRPKQAAIPSGDRPTYPSGEGLQLGGIHHVAYRCRDAKETVEFYRRNAEELGAPFFQATVAAAMRPIRSGAGSNSATACVAIAMPGERTTVPPPP